MEHEQKIKRAKEQEKTRGDWGRGRRRHLTVDQLEGIPESGIPEWLPLRKFHRHSMALFPSLPSFFPALSLALFFAHAPLSECLEQATMLHTE